MCNCNCVSCRPAPHLGCQGVECEQGVVQEPTARRHRDLAGKTSAVQAQVRLGTGVTSRQDSSWASDTEIWPVRNIHSQAQLWPGEEGDALLSFKCFPGLMLMPYEFRSLLEMEGETHAQVHEMTFSHGTDLSSISLQCDLREPVSKPLHGSPRGSLKSHWRLIASKTEASRKG
jgi:hypothetical protein